MIDRTAEELHCGELGQGVALLSCLLSSFFHYGYSHSLLIAISWATVTDLLISRSDFILFGLFCSSLKPESLFFFIILGSLGHFCFTWPYLNVIVLKPQPILNLLSTELLYSPLIQIIPNPPFDAVCRNSQAVSPKKASVGRHHIYMCRRMAACVRSSHTHSWDLM